MIDESIAEVTVASDRIGEWETVGYIPTLNGETWVVHLDGVGIKVRGRTLMKV